MSSASTQTSLDVELQPGKPPTLLLDSLDAFPGGASGWASAHRDAVRAAVTNHGSLLIRGLGLHSTDDVAAAFRSLAGTLMEEEREAFAVRTSFGGGVLSSTPWPANQQMCSHHELSYTLSFPQTMMFACLSEPTSGGATGVVDAPSILEALPADLVARFERQGWMLVRNYNEDIGASIADSFGTDDRAAVERYCASQGITCEWQPDGGLRTSQVRSAIVTHPHTGQRCWFNQIAFLSEWTIDPEVREFLVDMYGADGLPFTTRFGDGEPIGADVIDLLNATYEERTARVSWRAGDLLLVDNVRTAHSREAYEGSREILVGLADPIDLAECAPTVEVSSR